MGIGERKSKKKGGKVTRSRVVRVYADTGDRYPSGRKKYKQVVRTAGPALSTTPSQAWDKFDEEVDRQKRITEGGGPITLSGALDKLINERKLEKRSWRRYIAIKKNLLAYFKDILLDDFTEENCIEYKNERLHKGVSFSTIDLELSVIRHIIYTAIRNKRCSLEKNPVNKYVTIRRSNKRDRVLEIEEEAVLLPAMHWRPRLMAQAILLTGMRPGEAVELVKSRLDLRTNVLRLHKTKTSLPRELKMGPMLREVFTESLKDNDYDYVFLNCLNTPWKKTEYFDQYFKGVCEKVGLEDLKPHDLRHTYATRLVRRNVHLARVKYYLGHASIKTTERYIHVDTYSEDDVLISESMSREARELSRHNKNHNKLSSTKKSDS